MSMEDVFLSFLTVKMNFSNALVVNRGQWRTMQDNKKVWY